MQEIGARITDVPSEDKKINEALIIAMISTAAEISQRPHHWYCDQLNNHDAIDGYLPLGDEIWRQTGGQLEAFVHSVSTAHSIHGVTKSLWARDDRIRIVAVEPAESAVLSGKPSGSHKIEGIGIGFIPPLWQPELVNEILTVTTEEAKEMARRLAREEGIFAGASSGANVVAAIKNGALSCHLVRRGVHRICTGQKGVRDAMRVTCGTHQTGEVCETLRERAGCDASQRERVTFACGDSAFDKLNELIHGFTIVAAHGVNSTHDTTH